MVMLPWDLDAMERAAVRADRDAITGARRPYDLAAQDVSRSLMRSATAAMPTTGAAGSREALLAAAPETGRLAEAGAAATLAAQRQARENAIARQRERAEAGANFLGLGLNAGGAVAGTLLSGLGGTGGGPPARGGPAPAAGASPLGGLGGLFGGGAPSGSGGGSPLGGLGGLVGMAAPLVGTAMGGPLGGIAGGAVGSMLGGAPPTTAAAPGPPPAAAPPAPLATRFAPRIGVAPGGAVTGPPMESPEEREARLARLAGWR